MDQTILEPVLYKVLLKEFKKGIRIIIYEPLIKEKYFNKSKIFKSLKEFKKNSNIIIANRYDKQLHDVKDKVYTRDIFLRD